MDTERVRGNDLGPIGRTLAGNTKRMRGSTSLRALSARLAELGHPISSSSLQKIEAGRRRVEVDDVIALALALDVSAVDLLLPQPGESITVLGAANVSREVLRGWLVAGTPLNLRPDQVDGAKADLEQIDLEMDVYSGQLAASEDELVGLTSAIEAAATERERRVLVEQQRQAIESRRIIHDRLIAAQAKYTGLSLAIEATGHGDD